METTDFNDDDLKNAAPHLFSREKKNPFKVDDAYFEKLTDSIQKKINAVESVPIWQKLLQGFLAPQIALPILACLIFTIVFVFRSNTNRVELSNHTQTITIEELSNSDFLSQIDEQLIAESVPFSTTEQSTVDIENYLIENNINDSELTNELIPHN